MKESLGAALCASNQLVAQVNGPAERPELRCNRHLVLLLSQRGATPEDGIAERLRLAPSVLAIELDALESEGLIERVPAARRAYR